MTNSEKCPRIVEQCVSAPSAEDIQKQISLERKQHREEIDELKKIILKLRPDYKFGREKEEKGESSQKIVYHERKRSDLSKSTRTCCCKTTPEPKKNPEKECPTTKSQEKKPREKIPPDNECYEKKSREKRSPGSEYCEKKPQDKRPEQNQPKPKRTTPAKTKPQKKTVQNESSNSCDSKSDCDRISCQDALKTLEEVFDDFCEVKSVTFDDDSQTKVSEPSAESIDVNAHCLIHEAVERLRQKIENERAQHKVEVESLKNTIEKLTRDRSGQTPAPTEDSESDNIECLCDLF